MISNQKLNTLQLFLVFLMLLCGLTSSYGQWGEIIKIEQNGKSLDIIEIYIANQNGVREKFLINKKTPSKEAYKVIDGSIIEVPKNTIIGIKSINTNYLEIVAVTHEKIVEYLVSGHRELYRIIDENNSGNLLTRVINKIAGGVTTANITDTEDGGAESTVWKVWNKGENLNFEHFEGKVAMNFRSKIEMEDDIIKLDGENKRVLYLTETVDYLSKKNKSYAFIPDSLAKVPLTSEETIDKFFKIELNKQSRILKLSGSHAKKGFKMLGQGHYEEGIAEYTKAIELGEIDTDRFIQASLILTEAYHEMNAKKNIANSGFQSSKIKSNLDTWLDASLHFIIEADSLKNVKYVNFQKNGHKNIAKAFGYDLVLSKQYLAWAYIVKLKLNGCLENTDQNPLVLMKLADEIKEGL